MTDFTKVKMIRDALGSPIPQKWDEEKNRFIPLTVGESQGNSKIHLSTNVPADTDGKDGDIWIKYIGGDE